MFDFKNEVAQIKGWLTEREGEFLYSEAKKVKPDMAIVEIGSWKGKSTVCLAKGAQDGFGAKVVAIDPHTGSSEHQKMFGAVDTYQEFLQNIREQQVEQFIESIRDTSKNAARQFDKPIEFLFIDGAHEFRFVKLDTKCWFSKVVVGGTVAYHDTWHFPGPRLWTAMMLFTSHEIRHPRLYGTITVFEKVAENSFFERIYNILFLFYRFFAGAVGFYRLRQQKMV